MRFGGCHADICVDAQGERLGAAKTKRNLGVQDNGMVLKESCKAVFLGQPVIIVLDAQKQIMPLWHEISEAGFKIKAPEIEVVELIVVKQLFPDIDQSVQRVGDSRFVKSCGRRRNDKIALLTASGKGNVSRP